MAEVAQVTPSPVIENEGAPTTASLALDDPELKVLLMIGTVVEFWREPLHLLPVLAGVILVVSFGLIEFLQRRPVGCEVKFIDLKSKTPAELVSFAEENGVENASTMPKQELLFAILKQLRAPNQVAADPSVAVAADPSAAVAADPSAAVAADPSAALVWLVALALTAGWLYVLGAGASKLVLWLFF